MPLHPDVSQAASVPCTCVIVAFNSGRELLAAVDSALTNRPQHVLVIDNNSLDAAVAELRQQRPQVRVVRLATNVGFAAAANLGAKLAKTPYVLFQNDDAVLKAGYVAALVDALERHPHCVSAQGKLLVEEGCGSRVDSAGIRLDRFALRPTDRGQGEADTGQYDEPSLIFGATGAAAVFRREPFLAAGGGFAEHFFAYYEDVDVAWRLGRAGWSHLYWPEAVALHSRRGPQDKPSAVCARAFTNRYRTFLRNESARHFAAYAPLALPWEIARLLRLGLGRPQQLRAIARALPAVALDWWQERRL